MMSAKQYNAARAQLGWTHERMAEELGKSTRQMFRYANGEDVVPRSAERLIRGWLRDRATMSTERFEKRMRRDMSMTPGPWEWDWGESDNLYNAGYLAKEKERRAIYRAGGIPPAEFPPYSEAIIQTDNRAYGPNDDDARLIEAVPEMLDALHIFVAAMEPSPEKHDNLLQGAYQIARAAIAKATGDEHG